MRDFTRLIDCDDEQGNATVYSTPCVVGGWVYVELWEDGKWHITDYEGFEIYGDGYKSAKTAMRYASAKVDRLNEYGC